MKMPDKDLILEELGNINSKIKPENLEEYWINTVGTILYEKFAKYYNLKMWQIDDNTVIDANIPEWTSKGSLIYKGDMKNFHDHISAYPISLNGYDDYFQISTNGANILLDTIVSEYDILNKTIIIKDKKITYDLIINTISPDILFNYCYGKLKYVGLDFFPFVLPNEFALPKDVFFVFQWKEKI